MSKTASFFSNGFKMMTLADYHPKLNAQNEQRVMLDFSMPLNEDNFKGAPGPVSKAYFALQQIEDGVIKIPLITEFEGAQVELYATPQSSGPMMTLEAATLRKLEVTRPEDKATLAEGDVVLTFNTTVPATEDLILFAHRHQGKTVFAKFGLTQPALPGMSDQRSDEDGPSVEESQANIAGHFGGKDAAAGERADPEAQASVAGMTEDEKQALKVDKGPSASHRRAKGAAAPVQ